MRNLLLPRNLGALGTFLDARVLLAFDFDGTLAPIVRARDRAAMRPRTTALLRRLCKVSPVAVISGRELADVASRLEGAGVRYVVGNHGSEFPSVVWADSLALDEARSRLRSFAAASPGVEVEDKRYSLAVHFRGRWRSSAAETAVRVALADVRLPLRTIPGKRVVSVLPGDALHKGDALRLLRARERAQRVLYVGDDVTDEDVFRSSSPARLLPVRVGRSVASAARFFISSQGDIDGLLLQLVRLGERPRGWHTRS